MKLPLVALALLPLAACNIEAGNNAVPSTGLRAFEGDTCKVQLRRDMLGAEASLPIPPTTDLYNGAAVSISGRLEDADHSGIVLRSEGRDLWIPMAAILLVDFGTGVIPPTAAAMAAEAAQGVPIGVETEARPASGL